MNRTDTTLWRLEKNGVEAVTIMRPVNEMGGAELCFLWNGEVYFTRLYRNRQDLRKAAEQKRRALEGNGWTSPSA